MENHLSREKNGKNVDSVRVLIPDDVKYLTKSPGQPKSSCGMLTSNTSGAVSTKAKNGQGVIFVEDRNPVEAKEDEVKPQPDVNCGLLLLSLTLAFTNGFQIGSFSDKVLQVTIKLCSLKFFTLSSLNT